MPVRQDKAGRWRYQKVVHLPDGTRTRISGTPDINTKVAALAAEREHIERTLRSYYAPAEKKEVPTLTEFVDKRWLSTYPAAAGNRPRTIKEKKHHVENHLKPLLGDKRLDAIRGEVLARFFAALRLKKLSEKSIKNLRATLIRILASAREWDVIEVMPFVPRVKVPEATFDFYTQEESERLFAACRSPEERALLVFAVHTGARAGEQRALTWGDVDFANRLVVIRRNLPCGEKEPGPTKSGKERRVPISETLHQTLWDLRGLRHLQGGLVFHRPDGKHYSLWQLHERLWGAARRAGLREIRWHDLRHSFGSQLASAGVPIPVIQNWMGHSTITMTMRYAHLCPGTGAAIRALDVVKGTGEAAWSSESAERGEARNVVELWPGGRR